MQKLKTFYETQIVIPVKEIIQHFTREKLPKCLEEKPSYGDIQEYSYI